MCVGWIEYIAGAVVGRGAVLLLLLSTVLLLLYSMLLLLLYSVLLLLYSVLLLSVGVLICTKRQCKNHTETTKTMPRVVLL